MRLGCCCIPTECHRVVHLLSFITHQLSCTRHCRIQLYPFYLFQGPIQFNPFLVSTMYFFSRYLVSWPISTLCRCVSPFPRPLKILQVASAALACTSLIEVGPSLTLTAFLSPKNSNVGFGSRRAERPEDILVRAVMRVLRHSIDNDVRQGDRAYGWYDDRSLSLDWILLGLIQALNSTLW